MHFKITKKALIGPLARAASLAGSATGSVPVLSELLLTVNFGELTIIGGNGETYLKSVITDFEEIKTGSCCVPAKKLQEIVAKMGDVIEITSNSTQTTIISNKSRITLSGIDWDMYPELPEHDGESVTVMGSDFKAAIKKTAFAVAENASTPVLEGIKLSTIGVGKISAMACDRHRLAHTVFGETSNDERLTAVVKGRSLSDLEKMIDSTDEISLTFGDSYFFCKTNDFTFYSRIIDGTYPDTYKLIPSKFTTETKLNATDFRNALERSLVVAKGQKTKIVSLTITEQESVLKATTEGDTAIEELETKTTGEPIKINFNAEYVVQALKTITETNCTLHFTGPMAPFILRGEGNTNDTQLVLPYRSH